MMTTQSWVDSIAEQKDAKRQLAHEAAILEVTEMIYRTMDAQGVSKAELARRLGKSRAYVTQMLDGRSNLTIRSIADVLVALGSKLQMEAIRIIEPVAPERVADPRPTAVTAFTWGGSRRSDTEDPELVKLLQRRDGELRLIA